MIFRHEAEHIVQKVFLKQVLAMLSVTTTLITIIAAFLYGNHCVGGLYGLTPELLCLASTLKLYGLSLLVFKKYQMDSCIWIL